MFSLPAQSKIFPETTKNLMGGKLPSLTNKMEDSMGPIDGT
jgi:hypothetical protein